MAQTFEAMVATTTQNDTQITNLDSVAFSAPRTLGPTYLVENDVFIFHGDAVYIDAKLSKGNPEDAGKTDADGKPLYVPVYYFLCEMLDKDGNFDGRVKRLYPTSLYKTIYEWERKDGIARATKQFYTSSGDVCQKLQQVGDVKAFVKEVNGRKMRVSSITSVQTRKFGSDKNNPELTSASVMELNFA